MNTRPPTASLRCRVTATFSSATKAQSVCFGLTRAIAQERARREEEPTVGPPRPVALWAQDAGFEWSEEWRWDEPPLVMAIDASVIVQQEGPPIPRSAQQALMCHGAASYEFIAHADPCVPLTVGFGACDQDARERLERLLRASTCPRSELGEGLPFAPAVAVEWWVSGGRLRVRGAVVPGDIARFRSALRRHGAEEITIRLDRGRPKAGPRGRLPSRSGDPSDCVCIFKGDRRVGDIADLVHTSTGVVGLSGGPGFTRMLRVEGRSVLVEPLRVGCWLRGVTVAPNGAGLVAGGERGRLYRSRDDGHTWNARWDPVLAELTGWSELGQILSVVETTAGVTLSTWDRVLMCREGEWSTVEMPEAGHPYRLKRIGDRTYLLGHQLLELVDGRAVAVLDSATPVVDVTQRGEVQIGLSTEAIMRRSGSGEWTRAEVGRGEFYPRFVAALGDRFIVAGESSRRRLGLAVSDDGGQSFRPMEGLEHWGWPTAFAEAERHAHVAVQGGGLLRLGEQLGLARAR